MKKLTNIILALAAVALNCGCINEEEFQKEDRSGIRVYSDLARTRTEHHSENGVTSISWVEGDRIGLSTSAQGNLGYIADNSGPTSEFTAADAAVQAAEGDVVYAYYPYDEWSWAGTETSFHLPHTQGQTYSTGLSYYDALYAKGTVADNELALHFKHVFAFLKITVPVNKLERDPDSGCYVIRIISDQLISNIEGYYNIETSEFEADCTTDVMYWIDQDLEGQETVTITAAIMPQTYGTNIGIYAWFNNRAEELLRTITVPESGLQAGKIYTVTIRDEQQQDDKEKAVQALTALYYATDGDNWNNNTNWLSDEPLYKWYGLNANYWPEYTIEEDDIVEVQLFDNRLRGTLPPEFAYIMSKANSIEMHGNGLHGIIPQEVREHPKWQNFGWNILMQYPYWGGGFDFSEGTGLKLTDVEMPFFVENEARKASDVFAENELTLAVNVGLVDEMQGISEGVVDYYKKYQNKDLGMIVTVGGYWDYTYDEYRNYVLEERAKGLPEEIMWIGSQISSLAGQSMSYNGAMHLFDKESNLLGAWIGGSSESWEQIDAIVRERLGEPEVDGGNDGEESSMLILASEFGQKVWKWGPTDVYGNAGHTGGGFNFNAPGVIDGMWWGCKTAEELMDQLSFSGGTAYGDEASGAYMVFSEDGVVTSYKPTGKVIRSGEFEVKDYDPSRASCWEIGKLITSEPALLFPWKVNGGGTSVTEYDIMYLTPQAMTLVYTGGQEPGGWGEITYWNFIGGSPDPLTIEGTWTYGANGYGNGGHTGAGWAYNAPGVVDGNWWSIANDDDFAKQLSHAGGVAAGDEFFDAYMVFEGNTVTTYSPDGTKIRGGEWTATMNDYALNAGRGAASWELGKLTTSEPALLFPWKVNGGGTPVTEYDIMYFDANNMTLVYTGEAASGGWGEITHWCFVRK